MTLYEVFNRVAEALSDNSDFQIQISSYLRDTMDDDGEFTRSRYQKRSEQDILEDRELGTIQYIICGCIKPFHPNQIKYINNEDFSNLTDFKAEITWNKDINSLEEDKELLQETGYEHQTIIVIKP